MAVRLAAALGAAVWASAAWRRWRRDGFFVIRWSPRRSRLQGLLRPLPGAPRAR